MHVYQGLEDFALESVLGQVRGLWSEPAHLLLSASLSSGYIILRFPHADVEDTPPPLLLALLRFWTLRQGFLAVKTAYLCVADEELEDIRCTLKQEHIQKLSKPSKDKEAKGTTPGESQLLDWIAGCVTSSKGALDRAFSVFSEFSPSAKTFRATFSNPSRLLPLTSLSARTIETHVGDHVCLWLANRFSLLSPFPSLSHVTCAPGWSVDLKNPHLDVGVRVVGVPAFWKTRDLPVSDNPTNEVDNLNPSRGAFPPTLRILLTITLPCSTPTPPNRLEPLHKGRTSLLPSTAHLLTTVHPLLSPFYADAPPLSGKVFIDTCAGTGSIPYELLLTTSRKREQTLILSGDSDFLNIKTVMDTISSDVRARSWIEAFVWNANGVGGSLRDGTVDGIITGSYPTTTYTLTDRF